MEATLVNVPRTGHHPVTSAGSIPRTRHQDALDFPCGSVGRSRRGEGWPRRGKSGLLGHVAR